VVFIISEIGVNWDGDFDIAKKMMVFSKEVGCNAVKFQAFNEKNLGDHPEKVRLLQTSISKNNIESIDDIAKSVGIEWFCTPMYSEAVDFLEPYVEKFKIRELDGRPFLQNNTTELLNKVLKTDKEIFVSSQYSPKNSKFFDNSQIKWLYCVPKYPCDLSDLDFSEFEHYSGYSNHCPHFLASLMAVIFGAKILEIHTTLDKTKNYADNNVSFEFKELKNLIDLIKNSLKVKTHKN